MNPNQEDTNDTSNNYPFPITDSSTMTNVNRLYIWLNRLNLTEGEIQEIEKVDHHGGTISIIFKKTIPAKFRTLQSNIELSWFEGGEERWDFLGLMYYLNGVLYEPPIRTFDGWAYDELNIEYPPSRVIDAAMRYTILKEQKWRCNNCAVPLRYNLNSSWAGEVAQIDHIHPYSQYKTYPNGMNKINERINLQALCSKCNKEKYKNKN